MTTPFVQALATAAKQAREDHGLKREQIAVALDRSADKVRYFENGRAFTALNEMVDAYVETTGVSFFALLDEAKANLKKKG